MTTAIRRAALALLGASLTLTHLAGRADALADIKKKGELTCGVISTAKPFGFVDQAQGRDVVGYDVDIGHGLAKALGVKAALRQIPGDARIPELMQGRVDVLTAVLGYQDGHPISTPLDDCVLVMPTARAVRPGMTVVRLGKHMQVSANG